MFLLTTLPYASEQSRMEITYPKWCRVCQILWQDIRLMAIIILFYFIVLDHKQMKGVEYFVGALLIGDSVQNTMYFLFFLKNCHLTGFRKSTLQEQKVVAILRSWATSYVRLFRKQHDRLNALLLFESLGRTWLTFASLSSWSGGWETYSSEMKAEVFLVLPSMGPFWSTPLEPPWETRCVLGIWQCLGWGLCGHFPPPVFGKPDAYAVSLLIQSKAAPPPVLASPG